MRLLRRRPGSPLAVLVYSTILRKLIYTSPSSQARLVFAWENPIWTIAGPELLETGAMTEIILTIGAEIITNTILVGSLV